MGSKVSRVLNAEERALRDKLVTYIKEVLDGTAITDVDGSYHMILLNRMQEDCELTEMPSDRVLESVVRLTSGNRRYVKLSYSSQHMRCIIIE